jgi:hypothetical protein
MPSKQRRWDSIFKWAEVQTARLQMRTCILLIVLPPVSRTRNGKKLTKERGDKTLTLREAVVADLDALHRREHRDGRRQDPVANHHTGA